MTAKRAIRALFTATRNEIDKIRSDWAKAGNGEFVNYYPGRGWEGK